MAHGTELGDANGVTSTSQIGTLPDRTHLDGNHPTDTAVVRPTGASSESVQKRSLTEPTESEAGRELQTVTDANNNDVGATELGDEGEKQDGQTGMGVGKKKRKSKKSKSKRGLVISHQLNSH